MSRSRLRRPTIFAVGILLALAAAVIRGPIRRALRRAPPANRHQDEASPSVRITTVIDGDTVVTDAGVTIRLIGIDAPEMNTPYANRARRALAALVLEKTVELRFDQERRDKYGRTLAHILLPGPAPTPDVDELLVAARLLRQGLAVYYRVGGGTQHSFESVMIRAQGEAVDASRGLWSLPVKSETPYVTSRNRFHRPSCPHTRDIPRPGRSTDRKALLKSGKSPCRACRP